jgi:uncharacterized phage-associated protein
MAYVESVAAYILDELEVASTMKLQKLVFYSQAYHLVRTGAPLFDDAIEAWVNGPVVRALFNKHRHKFVIEKGFFEQGKLNANEAASVDFVVECLRDKTGQELSALTHAEAPWKDARGGAEPGQYTSAEISLEAIRRFYGSAAACANPVFCGAKA